MPPHVDLTGRRLGRLTVLSRGPRVKWGRWQSSWLCRCDCGATLTVPERRLPHRASIPPSHIVEACDDCRATPCEVCGTPIPPSSAAVTCSAECRAERQRQYGRDYVRGRRATDPDYRDRQRLRAATRYADMGEDQRHDYNRRRHRRALETHGRDAVNEQARTWHATRMETDAAYREARRVKSAAWRQQNLDRVRQSERDRARRHRAQRIEQQIGRIMSEDDDDT